MTESAAPARHRLLFVTAVVATAAVTAIGVVLAVSGSAAPAGPAAVVMRYFAALQRGDAAAALALGRPPAHAVPLLTDAVLREQQRIAPIGDVTIRAVNRRGERASVRVGYSLAFTDGVAEQRATLRLRRRDGAWRLRRIAGTTRLVVSPASQRATVLGRVVPNRTVALFPGAAPITFDTPYLQVSRRSAAIGLATRSVTVVRPSISRLGRAAATATLGDRLRSCLRSGGAACPLPSGRVVPGSVRGRRAGPLVDVRVRLMLSPLGIVDVRARADVVARFTRLTFRDVMMVRHGRFGLRLHTQGYVSAPLQLTWRSS